MKKITIGIAALLGCSACHAKNSDQNYTVIPYNYSAVTSQADYDIQQLLAATKSSQSLNQKISIIAQQLAGRPYGYSGVEGEGTYDATAHIQQDPIFRTDQFNCATLTQTTLALLHSVSLDDFKQTILHVEYGAANQPYNSVHYCNRNNFISADFNSVNQRNGYVKDITNSIGLSTSNDFEDATITPISWFNKQAQNTKANVRVLNAKYGPAMVQRFTNNYAQTVCPTLATSKPVKINYIPKSALVITTKQPDGTVSYAPNLVNVAKIPTPAIVEFVRDDAKWIINGQPINKIIGSGINVSHMGIIYRQQFKQGEVIYRDISCTDNQQQKTCTVMPIYCNNQSGCTRTMLLEASDAYPNGYYYYQQNGHYVCSANKPTDGQKLVLCNRVLSIPLGAYFTQKEYGNYLYMKSPSLVGVNVEMLTSD